MNAWLTPDWPAPARVRACVTTRSGGVSQAPFDSLNLGAHVDDDPRAVEENRRRLTERLECRPSWLDQVHGVTVVEADPSRVLRADASWSAMPGVACTIMTADCLPALFCDDQGADRHRSAGRRIQPCRVCAAQPIFGAMASMAAHSDG
ncbi:multi-copper polyphenol oxidoreductase, laccase [Pseudomonas aeruginosa VRFPA02]|nr:multi-copper polyphenol oxidoreductase, laccase [Pseudomonas aeruginosa VRFPA02]